MLQNNNKFYKFVTTKLLYENIRTYPFLYFLLKKLSADELAYISSIHLFGSVARGDMRPETDIDIFINCNDNTEFLRKRIDEIRENFYESKIFEEWRLMGVESPINIIVGKLEEWDMKNEVMKGIMMYGKGIGRNNIHEYVIVKWKVPRDVRKRVTLNRKLFGYWGKRKRYSGIVDKNNRISNAILIPTYRLDDVLELLKNLNIEYNTMRVFI